MNIVCTHLFNTHLSKIEGYKKDLGMSYTKKDNTGVVMDIKDKFVIEFLRENKTALYKVGAFGSASVYTWGSLPADQVWVYDSKGIKHIKVFDPELDIFEFEKYFASVIHDIG